MLNVAFQATIENIFEGPWQKPLENVFEGFRQLPKGWKGSREERQDWERAPGTVSGRANAYNVAF